MIACILSPGILLSCHSNYHILYFHSTTVSLPYLSIAAIISHPYLLPFHSSNFYCCRYFLLILSFCSFMHITYASYHSHTHHNRLTLFIYIHKMFKILHPSFFSQPLSLLVSFHPYLSPHFQHCSHVFLFLCILYILATCKSSQ